MAAPGITQIVPRLLLANIMSYFDPETLRTACLLCKELYDIIYHHPGMEQQVSPLLTISPSSEDDDDYNGRTEKLLQQLYPNRNKLQHIREVTIINEHKFGYLFTSTADVKKTDSILKQLRLEGVVSLNMSSISKGTKKSHSLPYTLASILPNLREIDLSNTMVSPSILVSFSDKCSRLEKITWNNIALFSYITIDGSKMRNIKNLKEIYMNDSEFVGLSLLNHALSDLDNDEYSHIFLFHKCSHVLERVSIKNSTVGFRQAVYIPQNALIKFIRNAPLSLTWFRSDLTPENIKMLRRERPEIEFV